MCFGIALHILIHTRRFPPLRGSNLLASHGPGEFAWKMSIAIMVFSRNLEMIMVENIISSSKAVMISSVTVHAN